MTATVTYSYANDEVREAHQDLLSSIDNLHDVFRQLDDVRGRGVTGRERDQVEEAWLDALAKWHFHQDRWEELGGRS